MQNVGLLIADEVQLVGGEIGPTYEVIISRTRYVSAQTEIKIRIVACSVSFANARDVDEWMGVPNHAIFNFLLVCQSQRTRQFWNILRVESYRLRPISKTGRYDRYRHSASRICG